MWLVTYLLGWCCLLTSGTHVVHVIIDDLGYDDPNFRNHQTLTPTMDDMVQHGVEIPEFYVYKMCAPSRASVLSGRYPFHVGYYNNNGCVGGGVPLDFKLLPGVLKEAGYSSHALGKWHMGWLFRNYTPTYRGFDSFLGTSGNTGDYWYHLYDSTNSCPQNVTPTGWPIVDIVDAPESHGIVPPANSTNINGTYDSHLLTQRAVSLIQQHSSPTKPLYLYLAYHNVHVPMHAPLDSVQKFPHVQCDARKVADAMLYEVDVGLSNIVAALKAADMYQDTVFIVHTDNGGPGSHACNWPLRGGKFTFWEGGVRGAAFVFSPSLPTSVQGTKFDGIAHLTDIYMTVAEGLAGLKIQPGTTGPIEPDGVNLWPALTSGKASPRTEVIHLPLPNQYANTTECASTKSSHGCSPSIRMGRYKLITAWPGEDELVTLPPLSPNTIPYGKSGGLIRFSHQAIGPHWKSKYYNFTTQNSTCTNIPCLFDVVSDPGESHDLGSIPQYQSIVTNLTERLKEVTKTAAPVCDIMSDSTYHKDWLPLLCHITKLTGYWLPVDWNGHVPPPVPTACEREEMAQCPRKKYPDYKSCRECCKDNKGKMEDCKPKDFQIYCNTTNVRMDQVLASIV